MTTVEDLVAGEVAGVQDALGDAGEHMRRHASMQNVTAAQRAIAVTQERLAILSAALTDAEVTT